jgi:excisionase family DNA binding protein
LSLPVLYTPKQVADLWKVSRRTIYAWIKSGQLKAVKLGDTVRIPESELAKLLVPIEPDRSAKSKVKPAKQRSRKPPSRKKTP